MGASLDKTTDMTVGNIHSLLIRFSLPLLAGNLFQQLYNIVDSIIVGNVVGKEALAAVGSTGSLINAVIGFFLGLAAGGSVVISQLFGARRLDRVSITVHTLMLGSIIGGIFLIIAGQVFSPVLLRMMATPDDVFPQALSYLRIYFSGMLFQLVYNVGAGILRALGDSKRPLYFLIISTAVNVVLDFVFVPALHWGIEGAAYATVISQSVSMILVLAVMLRTHDCYRLEPKRLHIDREALRSVLRQGLPGGIQLAITAFSNVFVQSYINSFGSAAMAGWASFGKIDQLSLLPMQSISLSATTFVGQNYGACNHKRIRQGVRVSMGIAVLWTVIVISVFEFIPGQLTSLFNRDKDVLYYGKYFLRACAPFYIFRCPNQVFAGSLRGLGNSLAPTVVLLSSFVAFRQIYLFVTTRLTDSFFPVSIAYPVGWAVSGILMTIVWYAYTKRHLKR